MGTSWALPQAPARRFPRRLAWRPGRGPARVRGQGQRFPRGRALRERAAQPHKCPRRLGCAADLGNRETHTAQTHKHTKNTHTQAAHAHHTPHKTHKTHAAHAQAHSRTQARSTHKTRARNTHTHARGKAVSPPPASKLKAGFWVRPPCPPSSMLARRHAGRT